LLCYAAMMALVVKRHTAAMLRHSYFIAADTTICQDALRMATCCFHFRFLFAAAPYAFVIYADTSPPAILRHAVADMMLLLRAMLILFFFLRHFLLPALYDISRQRC